MGTQKKVFCGEPIKMSIQSHYRLQGSSTASEDSPLLTKEIIIISEPRRGTF